MRILNFTLVLYAVLVSCSYGQGFRFVAVTTEKILGKYSKLAKAKKALNQFPPGANRPLRMIAEVKDNKIDWDPRFVGGEDQSQGLAAGFNIWWETWDDIENMISVARKALGDPKGVFIVVADGKALGKFESLQKAKSALDQFPPNSKTPRMVVEVKNGKVLDDPRLVAGQSQERGLKEGFNRYWTGWEEIDSMLWVAQYYLDQPKGPAKGEFIVVVAGQVKGKFKFLSKAQAVLNNYPEGSKPPSRLILEVKDGKVLDDPRMIAGRNQELGISAGFNSYWTGWDDIDSQIWAAETYLDNQVEVLGDFIVVAGSNAIGKFKTLSAAKDALKRWPIGAKSPSRLVVELKKGKVDYDPRIVGGKSQYLGMQAGLLMFLVIS